MSQVSVRYIVDDVDAAIRFYTESLGFQLQVHPAPGFAALTRDGARLLLNQPGVGSAGQSPGEGLRPRPGGWNRLQIEVDDLDSAMVKLRRAGRSFRGAPTSGKGGRQALVEDPSGNVVELFEHASSREQGGSGRAEGAGRPARA